MHQLRQDDSVLWKDTEQLARELALKMQQNFQDLGTRSEQMVEQLARNMEAMGDSLASNANSAVEELAARVMEMETESEMSKLALRTAIERNKDGTYELENNTSTRFETSYSKMEELHQAQLANLSAAMETVKKQQDEMREEGREELAESILAAEDVST
jgi:archaellum component FlaC